jgi:hypothetical protein
MTRVLRHAVVLPKRPARISSFGKLFHQFGAIKQFDQVGDGVIGRGVFARQVASKDGLRLKNRLDQYGIIHLAVAPFAHPPPPALRKCGDCGLPPRAADSLLRSTLRLCRWQLMDQLRPFTFDQRSPFVGHGVYVLEFEHSS